MFNCLNRSAAIHNISTLKTPYQEAADLVIKNTEGEDVHLKSAEGATQEDVVAMPMNEISIQKWWNLLCKVGPKFGYFPNSEKTVLITKNEQLLLKANEPQNETCTLKLLLGQHHSRRNLGKSVT